jgi:hypothetical protein
MYLHVLRAGRLVFCAKLCARGNARQHRDGVGRRRCWRVIVTRMTGSHPFWRILSCAQIRVPSGLAVDITSLARGSI